MTCRYLVYINRDKSITSISDIHVDNILIKQISELDEYFHRHYQFFLSVLSYMILHDKCREIEYLSYKEDFISEKIEKERRFFPLNNILRWNTDIELSFINFLLITKTYTDVIKKHNKDNNAYDDVMKILNGYEMKFLRYLRNSYQHDGFPNLWASCGFSCGFNKGAKTELSIRKDIILERISDANFKEIIVEKEGSKLVHLLAMCDKYIKSLCKLHNIQVTDDALKIKGIYDRVEKLCTEDMNKYQHISIFESDETKFEFLRSLSRRDANGYNLLTCISVDKLLAIRFILYDIHTTSLQNLKEPRIKPNDSLETLGF